MLSRQIYSPFSVEKSSLYNIFLAPNARRSLSSVMTMSTIPFRLRYANWASASYGAIIYFIPLFRNSSMSKYATSGLTSMESIIFLSPCSLFPFNISSLPFSKFYYLLLPWIYCYLLRVSYSFNFLGRTPPSKTSVRSIPTLLIFSALLMQSLIYLLWSFPVTIYFPLGPLIILWSLYERAFTKHKCQQLPFGLCTILDSSLACTSSNSSAVHRFPFLSSKLK